MIGWLRSMLAGSECGGKNSAKSYHKRTYIGLRVQ